MIYILFIAFLILMRGLDELYYHREKNLDDNAYLHLITLTHQGFTDQHLENPFL